MYMEDVTIVTLACEVQPSTASGDALIFLQMGRRDRRPRAETPEGALALRVPTESGMDKFPVALPPTSAQGSPERGRLVSQIVNSGVRLFQTTMQW